MTFSLYAAVIPQYQQLLGSLLALLKRAEDWCAAHGLQEEEVTTARLAKDMRPFAYQVVSSAVHSAGAIASIRRGLFRPYTTVPPNTLARLQGRVMSARAKLDLVAPEELDGIIGREMKFVTRFQTKHFTAEGFLLSFSQPNFYFHVSMAYAILRMKGVPIGKRDFLGALRVIERVEISFSREKAQWL